MTEAALGFAAVFLLALLRVPLAVSMALVGIAGLGLMRGWSPAFASTSQVIFETGFQYVLSVIPLFILMGNFVARAGMAKELFAAANSFVGHKRGGLAMASVIASGGFGAICGSSIATAATMTRVAYPEMKAHGYKDGLAAGAIGAGGTLGIMIPPSTIMVIYGIITETDIGKLFVAGILPGIVAIVCLCLAVVFITWRDPAAGTAGRAIHLGPTLGRHPGRLGRGGAVCAGDRRHLWRRVHRHRRGWRRSSGSVHVRPAARLAHAPDADGHPGRERPHHRDAVHHPDRGDDLQQLRELHVDARVTCATSSCSSAPTPSWWWS